MCKEFKQQSKTRGPPRVSMWPALLSKLNWDFYAENGQKVALKHIYMKKYVQPKMKQFQDVLYSK